MYNYNENLKDGLTHSQRSIRLLQQYGFQLSDSQYISVLQHDGLYVESNRTPEIMFSEDKLARITHFADSYTCFVNKI